jgi:Holliday junction resolvase RusA-like endonuclease
MSKTATLPDRVAFVIRGEPASKANSRKLVTDPRTGKPRFIKSQKARDYADVAAFQIPRLPRMLRGPVCVSMTIYYATQRPDLDESLILDLMQGRVYENDRQVRERHVYHGIDKGNPRAEIVVQPIGAVMVTLMEPA